GPVRMPPAVVGGQQVGQGGQQVVVAARAELDQRQARGRVGHEDVQQAVAPTGGGGGELGALAGDVPDRLAAPGADVDDLRLHAPDHRLPLCSSRPTTRGKRAGPPTCTATWTPWTPWTTWIPWPPAGTPASGCRGRSALS